MNFRHKWMRYLLGGILGAGAGFAYYFFVGCRTGTCPITANPFMSAGYGALIGLVISSGSKTGEAS
jgi:hypothetical protein